MASNIAIKYPIFGVYHTIKATINRQNISAKTGRTNYVNTLIHNDIAQYYI